MRLLADYLCPADWRINHFLTEYLYDTGLTIKLPTRTFVLDSAGLARELSLPPDRDEFISDITSSYRLRQGVLHNPAKDRRTTQGVFHVAEGGMPIPDDKLAVPKSVFAKLLQLASSSRRANCSVCRSPLSHDRKRAECFVSLLMRPIVFVPPCPDSPLKERWGRAFSRRAISSATLISSKAFLATQAILFFQRTTRDSMSSIGLATPAASFSRRI